MLSLSRNNGKTTSIIILVSYEIHIFIRVLSILLCLVVTSNYEVAHVNYVRISVIKIKIHSSCEIESEQLLLSSSMYMCVSSIGVRVVIENTYNVGHRVLCTFVYV